MGAQYGESNKFRDATVYGSQDTIDIPLEAVFEVFFFWAV